MDITKVIGGFFESELNIAFCLFIIFIAIRAYYVHTMPLKRTKQELNVLSSLIEDKKDQMSLLEALENAEQGFITLNFEISEFCEGLKRQEVDIDKHFNLVNVIEIPSKRKKAELVPGILTALGILGTFLGLLIGLSELNTSSNEDLTASVGTVINGMTLAFWTSIFGIVSSLVWNQFDKNELVQVRRELYRFRNKLFDSTGSKSTEDLLEKIENHQKEQTLALNNMGSDFAQILQDVLVPSIENGFTKAVDESLSPLLERIESVVVNFSERVSENQTDGLERIVENFIGSMNQAMNGQFDNLAKTIEELCEWQRQTKNDLEILINEMKKASSDQIAINQQTDRIISNISKYIETLVEGSEKIYNQVTAYEAIAKDVEVVIKLNQEVFNNINSRAQIIEETTTDSVKSINDISTSLKTVWSNSKEQLEMSSKVFNDSSTEFRESLHSGLISTFESFDTNISQIVNYFNDNIENIKETLVDFSKVSIDANRQLKESIHFLEESIKGIPKDLKVIVEKNTN